jgi:hypothetical protein
VRSAGGALEVGATLLHDGALEGDTQLAGADLEWRLDAVTTVRAELAASRSDDPLRADSATAWLAGIERVTRRLELNAYAREQQEGFGVGQQFTSESGTRKYGADLRWHLSERWSIDAELLRQEALGTPVRRSLAAAELQYSGGAAAGSVGLRQVLDESGDVPDRRSDLVSLTGSVDVLDRRMTLRGLAEVAPGGRDQSADYPSRVLLGVDVKPRDWTTLFAEWEHADGDAIRADTTRVGVRAEPWERTRVVTAVNQSGGEYGPRTFANFGLTQGFALDERWTLDVGVDSERTLRDADATPVPTPATPPAFGSGVEDFTAGFLGARYQQADWTLTSRVERRVSDAERRWVARGGWYREPVSGRAFSASLETVSCDATGSGADFDATDLRFAWARRPDGAEWILLNRSDFVHEAQRDGGGRMQSLRWINNLHVNWQFDPKQQAGVQLGFRHVVGTFDGARFPATTLLLGGDWRRDLPWRPFDRGLDAGAHVSWLGSLEPGVSRIQAGVDLGVTPATNVWVAVGYNFAGYRDEDFSAGRRTERGPYISVRMKLDQDTFKDLRLDSLRPPR